jgi:chromosome segregation ATPase
MRSVLVLGVTLVCLPVLPLSTADKAADFLEALKYERGCNTIPYALSKEKCRTTQDNEVKPYCDETSCERLGTRGLLENITRLEDNLKTLRQKEAELSRKSDRTPTEDQELADTKHKIDEQSRALDPLKTKLEDTKRQITGRIEKGQRCREARIDVVDIFTDVIDDVDDESEEAIKPLAQQLLEKLRRAMEEHTKEIVKVQEGIDACKLKLEGRE